MNKGLEFLERKVLTGCRGSFGRRMMNVIGGKYGGRETTFITEPVPKPEAMTQMVPLSATYDATYSKTLYSSRKALDIRIWPR